MTEKPTEDYPAGWVAQHCWPYPAARSKARGRRLAFLKRSKDVLSAAELGGLLETLRVHSSALIISQPSRPGQAIRLNACDQN